jgi:hypothetical protein
MDGVRMYLGEIYVCVCGIYERPFCDFVCGVWVDLGDGD